MFKSASPNGVPSGTPILQQEESGTGGLMKPVAEAGLIDREQEEKDIAKSRIIKKEQNIEGIKRQCSELISELYTNEDPEAIVKKHISQLKKYNELKDIALGLVTMIADQRKLRTTDILEEMKVELEDDQ